jgi:hypothetical protein
VLELTPRASRAAYFAAFGVLLIAGAWLRFAALDRLELFVDEGGHLLVPVDADVRRVIDPVGEGKPAMLWFFRVAWALPLDPLVAARAMIGCCGLISATAIAATLALLSGRRAALLGFGIWLLLPFAVFHERLALFDPAIAALIACSIAAFAAASRPSVSSGARAGWSVLGGLLAGGACLLKVSAAAAAPWLVVVYFALQCNRQQPFFSRRLAATVVGFLVPMAWLVFATPGLGEKILHPVSPAARTPGFPLFGWYAGYGGWPLGVLMLGALVAAWRKVSSPLLWLAAAWALSVAIAAAIYPTPYARYVHADHLLLVIFLAGALASAPVHVALPVATLAFSGWAWTDWQIVRDPRTASLPAGEIAQYVTGVWSGHGSRAVIDFAAHHSPAVVFVHRYSRPASYALLIAARQNPSLGVVPLSVETSTALAGAKVVLAKARTLLGPGVQTYLLAEGDPPPEPFFLQRHAVPFQVAFDHAKPDGASHLLLLRCDFDAPR